MPAGAGITLRTAYRGTSRYQNQASTTGPRGGVQLGGAFAIDVLLDASPYYDPARPERALEFRTYWRARRGGELFVPFANSQNGPQPVSMGIARTGVWWVLSTHWSGLTPVGRGDAPIALPSAYNPDAQDTGDPGGQLLPGKYRAGYWLCAGDEIEVVCQVNRGDGSWDQYSASVTVPAAAATAGAGAPATSERLGLDALRDQRQSLLQFLRLPSVLIGQQFNPFPSTTRFDVFDPALAATNRTAPRFTATLDYARNPPGDDAGRLGLLLRKTDVSGYPVQSAPYEASLPALKGMAPGAVARCYLDLLSAPLAPPSGRGATPLADGVAGEGVTAGWPAVHAWNNQNAVEALYLKGAGFVTGIAVLARSTDYGRTWRALASPPGFWDGACACIDPHRGRALFFGFRFAAGQARTGDWYVSVGSQRAGGRYEWSEPRQVEMPRDTAAPDPAEGSADAPGASEEPPAKLVPVYGTGQAWVRAQDGVAELALLVADQTSGAPAGANALVIIECRALAADGSGAWQRPLRVPGGWRSFRVLRDQGKRLLVLGLTAQGTAGTKPLLGQNLAVGTLGTGSGAVTWKNAPSGPAAADASAPLAAHPPFALVERPDAAVEILARDFATFRTVRSVADDGATVLLP
jgi:hypothetical protein